MGADQHDIDKSNVSSIKDDRQGEEGNGSRSQKEMKVLVNFNTSDPMDSLFKYEIVQNKKREHILTNRSLRYRMLLKRLIQNNFGDDGTIDALSMSYDYDALTF